MRKLVVAFLVTLLLTIITPSFCFAQARTNTSGHGCAPPVPPGIAGNPAPAPATSGIIAINEVLLFPHSTWNCSESGTYLVTMDTWVELYNTQNVPFNLYAAHAVLDSGPNTNPYYFPFGASIAAHGYLVLFPRTNASFYSTETPTLRLVINGVPVDQITIPTLGPDQSYARISDGASSWEISSTPTIDASNTPLLTPTPTPTPTASTSSGGQGSTGTSTGSRSTGTGTYSGSAGGSYSGTSNSNNQKTLVSGNQPHWSNLQLPAATSTLHTATTPTTLRPTTLSSSPSASSTRGLDLSRRIALTLLVIVLASALFWCWRVFRTP